jgi:aryl-alcohol dehydrogenase-like predicted oxidoreductase
VTLAFSIFPINVNVPMTTAPIPENMFGITGRHVTRVGLGGEGILRTHGRANESREVIRTALEEGITYFDSARVYDDSERYYGSLWGQDQEARMKVFQASKSASRDYAGAMTDLDQTLERLNVASLDLWQIHDVRTAEDMAMITSRGGALKAFLEAKASGRVRFIGVTGHHDPQILTQAVTDWPIDSVMMPVNPVESVLGGFLTSTMDAARTKGIAVIGMKVLGASSLIYPQAGAAPDILIRYALSCGVTVAIVGCSKPSEVQVLAEAARYTDPLSESEKIRLNELFRPYAQRLAYYRGVI